MKDVALLLTQYEIYGSIGEEEYIQYFIDEELNLDESDIGSYNEYLSENKHEIYYSDFDDMLYGYSPQEAVRMTYFGKFKYCHDYFQFNGYNNIDSFTTYEVVREMKNDKKFLKWYIEENELIDFENEEVISAIRESNELIKKGY